MENTFADIDGDESDEEENQNGPSVPTSSMSAPSSANSTMKIDHATLAARATHMVEILSDENRSLRRELDRMYDKVAKMQKFEQDIQKVQTDHEMLVETSRKREQLETVYKWKLENEIKRLQQHNQQLLSKLEYLQAHYTNKELDPMRKTESGDMHSEMNKRGSAMAQRQDSDMNYARMEEEMVEQRVTLDEQRLHIEVLDNALSNAQANVVKLQEECKRRQAYLEKANMLESQVGSLQIAIQKREIKEQQVRELLEKEIERLKAEKRNSLPDEGVSGLEDNDSTSLADLIREKDETIMKLEAEVCKWQQKYLEECTLRQSQDIPRVAPDYSKEAADGGYERPVAASNGAANNQRINELDARLNKMTSQLEHKDMLIQILRQQILERDSSISSSSSRSTSISPNSSVQNIRRNSTDSLLNRSSPGNSINSLQSIPPKSPYSSNQNLYVGSRSPVTSLQNLSYMSRSPVESQQNLVLVRHTTLPLGSQERIPGGIESGVSSYPSSVTTSGVSIGASGSESDLSKERTALDEKLKQLDLEIEERDKILGPMWTS